MDRDQREDGVRTFLRRRGAAPQVVEGGLEYLVRGWERTVHEVEDGYGYGIDDWLNDLDGRQLILEATPHADAATLAGFAHRIAAADDRFRAATVAVDRCLWGERTAAKEGLTREQNWWYWRDLPGGSADD